MKIAAYFAGKTNRVQGQVDLVYRKGKFFLYATCDMPEDTPLEPDNVLGVDLGVKNIAVDNTGKVFSNEKVETVRRRIHKHRADLQRKGTKNAKRRLRQLSGREARFRINQPIGVRYDSAKECVELECQAPTLYGRGS